MQENVVDIIISISKRLISGETLQQIKAEDFSQFQKSEFIAAYSFVIEKKIAAGAKPNPIMPRILHFAERMMIEPKAYGYLIELNKLGVLSASDVEFLIEKTMINSMARISYDMMKTLVAKYLFQLKSDHAGFTAFLKGNEKIN